ncbi:hypothetical protein BH10PSE19_BH10PSE19_18700 [soil metagenome]
MRLTSKGQVTIPLHVRKKMQLSPHTNVEFVREGERFYIVKAEINKNRVDEVIARMRGKATIKMSTDEIMKLLRED